MSSHTYNFEPILPPARTQLEEWTRWLNRMETELRTLSYYTKRKIRVRYDG